MKELYSFTIDKEKEVEVKQETSEGTLTKKEKKSTPVKIILKKPSRLDIEKTEEYYAVAWSQLVRNGVLTKPQLLKVYSDEIGTMTNSEQESYFTLYNKYFKLREDFVVKKSAGEDTSEISKEIEKVYFDITTIENKQAAVFDQTAEVKARNKTIQWLMLNLTFIEDDGGVVKPLFEGDSYDKKADYYFEINEQKDPFYDKVFEKAALTWSFWYMGRAASKEDFDSFIKEDGDQSASS